MVMSIQKKKAVDKGVLLVAEFPGFSETDQADGELQSPFIMADEGRIIQILLNLQSNGLKFTDTGSVTITVQLESQEEDQYLRVTVADTGIGIKQEDLSKLF